MWVDGGLVLFLLPRISAPIAENAVASCYPPLDSNAFDALLARPPCKPLAAAPQSANRLPIRCKRALV